MTTRQLNRACHAAAHMAERASGIHPLLSTEFMFHATHARMNTVYTRLAQMRDHL
jgi:hypothetical protein